MIEFRVDCSNCKWTGWLNAFGAQKHQMLEVHCPICKTQSLTEKVSQ